MASWYTYEITVSGTDIKEYYRLERELDPDQVAEIWLHHVRNGSQIGPVLAESYSGSVEVEQLWSKHQEPPEQQRRVVTATEIAAVLGEAPEET